MHEKRDKKEVVHNDEDIQTIDMCYLLCCYLWHVNVSQTEVQGAFEGVRKMKTINQIEE